MRTIKPPKPSSLIKHEATTMKNCHYLIFAFNTIYVIIFFLLLSYAMHVDGLRALKDKPSPLPINEIFINLTHSGPSDRGEGH